MVDIGRLIKEARQNKGWSQTELAQQFGISYQALQKWEKNKSSPGISDLPIISRILGIDISSLTGGNAVNPHLYANIHDVPFLSVKATASFVDLVGQERYVITETFPVYFPPGEEPKENQIVVEIDGDSMETTIMNHSKVLIEEIPLNDMVYANSGIYAVVYDSQFVVKRIKENQLRQGILTLYSDNPKAGYFTIERNIIRAMWKAIKIVEQRL